MDELHEPSTEVAVQELVCVVEQPGPQEPGGGRGITHCWTTPRGQMLEQLGDGD